HSGVFTVPAAGGPITRVPVSDSGSRLHRPELLPDGRSILITRFTPTTQKIGIIDRATGKLTILVDNGTHAHYVPTGHLIFGRFGGGLFAVPFDLRRRTVTGPATPVLDGVMVLGGGAVQFAVADNGTAVYLSGSDERGDQVALVEPDGKERVLTPRGNYWTPRFSPDGNRIVVSAGKGSDALYLIDARLGTLTRLTFTGDDAWPIWSPDGKSVTFFSRRAAPDTTGLYRVPADGSAPPRLLFPAGRIPGAPTGRSTVVPGRGPATVIPGRWSRDGLHLLYAWDDSARSGNIDILSVAGDSVTSRPYLHESWTEWDPDLSPDGRWVAYASNEAGNFEVFVRGLPIPGAKYQVSQ